jgi:hypothetical protein
MVPVRQQVLLIKISKTIIIQNDCPQSDPKALQVSNTVDGFYHSE